MEKEGTDTDTETSLNESVNRLMEDDTHEEGSSFPLNINQSPEKSKPHEESVPKHRYVRLPLARVKQIMKMDPDCGIIAQDAVFLVTKATEMFIEYMARETGKQLASIKRKTVMKRDVDVVIESIPHLCFLDGALE